MTASRSNGDLVGQIAVVTGAGRGIGRAVALRLASMGATVWLVARDTAKLTEMRGEIEAAGARAEIAACDLLSAEAIAALGKRVEAVHGRCDILVNNAAIGGFGKPLHEMPVDEFDTLIATNLRAPFLLMRAFTPAMIAAGKGHIVNISSLAGKNALPNGAAYSASKWGLNGLTYSAAEELRNHGVRVSVVAPGSVNTHFGPGSAIKDPAKKIQPEDVAAVVALLVVQAPTSFISEVLVRPTRK